MTKVLSPFLLFGLLAGVAVAIQAGVNAQLRQFLASPLQAAFISFLVGTIALGCLAFLNKTPWPRDFFSQVPWWALTGGLLGAFYISTAVVLAPRLGALALIALVIAGQLLTALVLDHFGLLALPKVSLSLSRVAGAILLMGGVLLILRRGN